jgi:hypothetical protein
MSEKKSQSQTPTPLTNLTEDKMFVEPKQKKSALVVDPPLTVEAPNGSMDQRWAVISIITPEDRVKQRFFFSANKFLCYNVNKQLVDATTQIARDTNTKLNELFAKKVEHYKSSSDPAYGLVAESLLQIQTELAFNEEKMVSTTLRQYRINPEELVNQFDHYASINEKEITAEFTSEHDIGTSIRGLKIRGVYEDLQHAKMRGKHCRDNIEEAINTYVMPVGRWCPLDVNPDGIKDQDYMVEQLNEMMTKYNENVEQKNAFFEKHKATLIETGAEEREKTIRSQLKEQIKAKRDALKASRTAEQ